MYKEGKKKERWRDRGIITQPRILEEERKNAIENPVSMI